MTSQTPATTSQHTAPKEANVSQPQYTHTTVDLTPSPDGFGAILERFAVQIIDDVKVARKGNDWVLLISLIENAASLGQTTEGRVALARLIRRLNDRLPVAAR